MFDLLEQKKSLLDQKRPMPPHTLRTLREHLLLEWTYHSNAIEGNTLTISETKVVLQGVTIGGKSLREHLEVVNHKEAIIYVEEIVRNQEDFSEWQVRNIHRLILNAIDQENAGVYRKENVIIGGARHIPPDYFLVPEQMSQLVAWYFQSDGLHPIARATMIHSDFVKIHPFVDGNGRTARLLMNLELMKNGYPPIVIRKEIRAAYYDSLDKAHTTGNIDDFLSIVKNAVSESLDLYLKVI
jgi:Fic family protein